jgi:hypothetical protein
LAGRPAYDEIAAPAICGPFMGSHIADIPNVRKSFFQNGRGKRIDFSETDRLPTKRIKSNARRLNAGEQADVTHHAPAASAMLRRSAVISAGSFKSAFSGTP